MAPRGKFASADFWSLDPAPWNFPGGETQSAGFRCKRGEFVTFWRKGRVAREVRASIARAFILTHEGALAGYLTLLADKLSVSTELLEDEKFRYRTFPAVKIGLLAADERASGAGRRLVEWALEYAAFELAPLVGVRFVTVDALYDDDVDPVYDCSEFYGKIGFRFTDPDETLPPENGYRSMYFDLQSLLAASNGQS